MKKKLHNLITKFDTSIITDYGIAVLCGLFLARMTLEAFIMMNVDARIKNASISIPEPTAMITSSDLNMIFNKSDKPKEASRPTFDQAGIIVKGILFTPPKSSVILALDKKGEYIYYEGEIISNGIKISAVEPDKVIFEDAGQFYELTLEDESIDLFKGIEYNDTPDAFNGSAGGVSGSSGSTPTSGVPSIAGNEGASKILAEVEKNPTTIFKYMSFQQEFEGEQLKGVKITLKANAEVFESAGLKSGDLVVSINGFGPADFSTPKFLNGLKKANKLDFEVERDGLKQSISVSR